MLKVNNLCKKYHTPTGPFQALTSVSFSVERGSSLCFVGESGAGKSSIAKCILGVTPFDHGEVSFDNIEINYRSPRKLRRLWEKSQMIWQDPHLAVNPHLPVWKIVSEPLINFKTVAPGKRDKKIDDLLIQVGLSPDFRMKRPHQLSGGECQRVCIARALAPAPELLVCDEPVSALDLPTQVRIMDLLLSLKNSLGIALILITHDMGLACRYSDNIAVVHQGKIVETQTPESLFNQAVHPCTRELISSIPELPWTES